MATYLVRFFGDLAFSANIEADSPKQAAKEALSRALACEAKRVPRNDIDFVNGVRGDVLRINIYRSKRHKGISAAPAYPTWNLLVKNGQSMRFSLDFILEKVQ